MRYLFVGEKRSQKAIDMGVTWVDGRLAAKQLFDALRAVGIDPDAQRYDNLFEEDPPDRARRRVRRAAEAGWVVVGLGQKVCAHLREYGIRHVPLTHPAARGTIRRKDRYAAHVRAALVTTGSL